MIEKVFKNYRVLGIVGSANSGKSSLVLSELLLLKDIGLDVYAYGVEDNIKDNLKSIKFLENREDLLDLKIKNSVIFIDEFADLFDVQSRGKQFNKIKRFFNRIYHLNNFVIISTAQEGFWNKFMNGIVKAFFVKSVEFDSLVNGTVLKKKVLGLSSTSDYRLELNKNEYFYINDKEITTKHTFEYNKKIDSKKDKINPFEKCQKKSK